MKALLEDHGGAGGRHKYKLSLQLKKEMNQALLKYYEGPSLAFACPFRMLKMMNERGRSWLEEHKLIKIKWVDCTAFRGASAEGKLFPLIQELRKQQVIIIGPAFLRNLKGKVFNYLDFIEIDPTTGYLDRTVIPKVLACQKKYGDGLLYSFSMGPGSNVCIPNLYHEMLRNFLIDFGSVWDIFCGVRSRKYMNPRLYSDETLKKNLGLWGNLSKSEKESLEQGQLKRLEQFEVEQLERVKQTLLAKKLRKQKEKKHKFQQHKHKKHKH